MEMQEQIQNTPPEQSFVLAQEMPSKKGFTFRGKVVSGGKKMTALKGIIYGDNGAGKTSTLACAKNPIILDMEGNCGHIESEKESINSYLELREIIEQLIGQDHDYQSLILDSLDSIETLISTEISCRYSQAQLDFGKGVAIWKTYVKELVDLLNELNLKKGMNILFTAHYKVKSANNPMTEQYDRYDLRINEAMKTGFCNWVQFICLLQKEPILKEQKGEFGKNKVKNLDRRVLYTRGNPTYYGKNVFNLPEKILMSSAIEGWEQFTTNVKNFYTN